MKNYNEKQLEENYEKFLNLVRKACGSNPERLEKLLKMYSMDELGPNLIISPASGNVNYHNAYEGGYIDHVMNVCKNALRMKKTFEDAGGVVDFTDEQLLFAALHHDLGKLGIKDELHYVPNDSKWHIENRGDVFMRNDNIPYMTLTDRTFFTLNHYGIQYDETEYFGIKLTDGMYDEDNQKYLKVYDVTKYLRSRMQFILHWADHMSTVIERQQSK